MNISTRVLWIVAVVCLSACVLAEPLEVEEICKNVGFQISSRTLDCTGDQELAVNRFDTFKGHYSCTAVDQDVTGFDCAQALGALACEQVEALDDDLDAWLATSESCARILERKPDAPDFVPDPTPDPQPTPQPEPDPQPDPLSPELPPAGPCAQGQALATPPGVDGLQPSLQVFVAGPLPDPLRAYTIEMWVKTIDTATLATLLASGGSEFALEVNVGIPEGGCGPRGQVGSIKQSARPINTVPAAAAAPMAVFDGQWHHLAFIYAPEGFSFAVDGAVQFHDIRCIDPGQDFNPWTNLFSARYVGLIDELRIWTEALDEETIRARKDRPLSSDELQDPALQAYYNFDELIDLGQGAPGLNDLVDLSVHAAHGELRDGAELVADCPF